MSTWETEEIIELSLPFFPTYLGAGDALTIIFVCDYAILLYSWKRDCQIFLYLKILYTERLVLLTFYFSFACFSLNFIAVLVVFYIITVQCHLFGDVDGKVGGASNFILMKENHIYRTKNLLR